ncbi:MAG TPA: amidohydrolase family protein, partial [Gemmatimonadaceae bacterium]
MKILATIATIALGTVTTAVHAQAPTAGKRAESLAIRNAIIVDGAGTPAIGPADIIIKGNRIDQIAWLDPVSVSMGTVKRVPAATEIDAAGKYVLPGLINAHAHIQNERAGIPQPLEYELKIWLASGITTVREVSAFTRINVADLKGQSERGEIAAPRILNYSGFNNSPNPQTPDAARQRVRDMKKAGVDGIKVMIQDREMFSAIEDEAHKAGLRIAHHAGVAETNAWDDIRLGTTSIEHWYGIPDAAIEDGVQNFPPTYNYNNEVDRFRYAGHLWREADSARLMTVLDSMVARKVAWVPTLDIYEASRDLMRAQNQPWFDDYLHPTLEEYFKPNPNNHGSYFLGWTSTDETFWKENYRIWMNALRQFERRGGLIGVGDDAGFIYQLYGFGLIRELELHQEAGFNTIKVIQHATTNNARILGRESELGRIKVGYLADLIVVDGNPLENLKVLYPTGIDHIVNGKQVH